MKAGGSNRRPTGREKNGSSGKKKRKGIGRKEPVKKRQRDRGALLFQEFFGEHYGERWPQLREALEETAPKIGLRENLEEEYFLDALSLRAVRLLEPEPGQVLLDLCAAPGGKSLALCSLYLSREPSLFLYANEYSAARRGRLKKVLTEHLPPALLPRVRVTLYDGRKWGLRQKNFFDRILIDSPCSSERNLIHRRELDGWTKGRSRSLQVRQFALLVSALDAAKIGARLLYCTCSIHPGENDGIIRKLLSRREGRVRVRGITPEEGEERSRWGILALPDRCGGRGPLYMSLLEKTG